MSRWSSRYLFGYALVVLMIVVVMLSSILPCVVVVIMMFMANVSVSACMAMSMCTTFPVAVRMVSKLPMTFTLSFPVLNLVVSFSSVIRMSVAFKTCSYVAIVIACASAMFSYVPIVCAPGTFNVTNTLTFAP